MAYELTISGAIIDSEDDAEFSAQDIEVSRSGNRSFGGVQSVGFSADEAINLGELSGATLGYALFKNLDATNYVEIRVADDGADIIKLRPGKIALFEFGSDVTAPFAIANTAACRVKYKIWEA